MNREKFEISKTAGLAKKLFMLCLLCSMLSSYAQNGRYNEAFENQTFPGYAVTVEGDTIHGKFVQEMHVVMQMGCQIFDFEGTMPAGQTFDKILCYVLEGNSKWYSSALTTLKPPKDPRRGDGDCFMVTNVEGPITLFDYNYLDEEVIPPVSETKQFMQLPNGDVVNVATMLLGFKKKMSAHVSDYPELSKKIAKKEKGYGVMGLVPIVKEYNEWYLKDHPDFTIIK